MGSEHIVRKEGVKHGEGGREKEAKQVGQNVMERGRDKRKEVWI